MADCGNCVHYERGYCDELNTHVTSYGSCSRYVGIGKDDTLFAKIAGRVKFERLGRSKKQVSVYPE